MNGKSILETKIFTCVWIQTSLIFTVLQSKYEKSIFKFVKPLNLNFFFQLGHVWGLPQNTRMANSLSKVVTLC